MVLGTPETEEPSHPVYSGPSQAQIQAQIAAQQAAAAERRREAAAHAQNDQGVKASRNGNYSRALAYYEKALELSPNDQVIQQNVKSARGIIQNDAGVAYEKEGNYREAVARYARAAEIKPGDSVIQKNLANARESLRNQEAQEEQRQRDKITANKMQQSIQALAQTLNAAPSSGGLAVGGGTSSDNSDKSSDLAFMATTGPPAAPGQGTFNTTVSHPTDLVFGDPNALPGTDTSSGKQLTSIDHHKSSLNAPNLTTESEVARGGFDTGVTASGQLNAITKDGGNPMRDPEVPEKYKKDKDIVAATTKRDEDKKAVANAEAELKTLEQSHPEDRGKIAEAKQKSSTARSQLGYDNFAIGEHIRALSSGSLSTTAK